MKNLKKIFIRISLLYIFIISFVNYIGYLLASSGQLPNRQNENSLLWIDYMADHYRLVNVLGVIGFLIPVIMCFSYTYFTGSEKLKRRIINIPLFYSLFGVFGWISSFILQLITMSFAKFSVGLVIHEIALTSALNILQASLFIFTLGFLILYTINRTYVLPKCFPNENIIKIEGAIRPSVKFLFTVFYFSVGLFPIFYFYSTFLNASMYYGFSIETGIYIVVSFILVSGIVMLITFSNFFEYPLKKIKKGTENVRNGIYTEKVEVVSNDSFGELAYTFNEMTSALDEKTRKILDIQNSVIRGMAVMVESRDNSTGGHINRTSDCVKVFVNKLRNYEKYKDLSDEFCESVIKAAPMHDLGKIAVDDAILRKPGKFTDEEYEIMKKHSAEGARIVENVLREVDNQNFKTIAVNVAHYHHEKWNGTGYPEKIAGNDIPFEARIMALADVFDALVSKRCYKDSFSYDKAFQIIEESLGTHFDPDLGEIFIKSRKELEELYNSY